MLVLKGKFGEAKVLTNNMEQTAISQVMNTLNYKHFENTNIRIMPDVHSGAGCVIGYTAKLTGDIVPNIVGVDIGCGMLTVNLGNIDIDFADLDRHIRENVPHGFNVHSKPIFKLPDTDVRKLQYYAEKVGGDYSRFAGGIGTLGGGNHFIEVAKSQDGNKHLVIHTGSRNLGNLVAKYHQNKAVEYCKNCIEELKVYKKERIKELVDDGKTALVSEDSVVQSYHDAIDIYNVPKDLAFLQGEEAEEYYRDMAFCQTYANLNREAIAKIILKKLGIELTAENAFHTIHNYIDFKHNIVRKGAISAQAGEKVLIPMNMRDGSILAVGKGNEDWNYSAPHGAGRLMSRGSAKEDLSLDDFKETMKDVWTTSVKQSTLDEAPEAYKPMQEIIDNIGDTVDIIDILKPLYNFKS